MVSSFFIGTSLEIVSCLQWAIISQWISSHCFFMPLHGIYPAPLSCQSAYLQYATIIRRVRPWRRAYSRGLSHMGFHTAATNCASSRHSILRLWRGPSPRAYARGIISHELSCRCDELCLFEALHPAPLARPFSKGLHAGIISHGLSYRCDELCLFEALYPAPLARPFSKGLHARIISHGLSYRCSELCLFEALYPAPLARPFSKGLRAGGIF